MYAQSVVEYGALASAKSNLQSVAYYVRDSVAQAGPGVWLALGGLLILVIWLKRR